MLVQPRKKSKLQTVYFILRFALLLGWIMAPMLLHDACEKRERPIPEDIMAAVYLVWYGAGLGWTWYITKDQPIQRDTPRKPTYIKNPDDWIDR